MIVYLDTIDQAKLCSTGKDLVHSMVTVQFQRLGKQAAPAQHQRRLETAASTLRRILEIRWVHIRGLVKKRGYKQLVINSFGWIIGSCTKSAWGRINHCSTWRGVTDATCWLACKLHNCMSMLDMTCLSVPTLLAGVFSKAVAHGQRSVVHS